MSMDLLEVDEKTGRVSAIVAKDVDDTFVGPFLDVLRAKARRGQFFGSATPGDYRVGDITVDDF